MRTVLAIMLLAFCAGCVTFGSIAEGRPRHVARFPPDTAFFVDQTDERVRRAFEDALKARGFEVVDEEEAGDYVIKIEVTNWEYNDAGFSGFGNRDDISLSVRVVDRRKNLVESRATIEIRSDFKIIGKYVETL
ncbi:MAG: hypothetical protein ACI4Q3_07300 [Kiritimatiellia bacterium]